jgi:hypothetical protein
MCSFAIRSDPIRSLDRESRPLRRGARVKGEVERQLVLGAAGANP